MRSTALLLAALTAVSACKKKPVDTGPVAPTGITHPDLVCAPGTIGYGAPPPDGNEVYCGRHLPDGTHIRQGMTIAWHSASRRKHTGQYVDGKQSGAWQVWHANGTLKEQGNYVADNREGRWVMFHANAERAAEGDYVAGREMGSWVFWSEDGTTRTEGQFDDLGQRTGTWTDYAADDTPLRERKYRNGRLYNQREIE